MLAKGEVKQDENGSIQVVQVPNVIKNQGDVEM